jgi:hypothetical protein
VRYIVEWTARGEIEVDADTEGQALARADVDMPVLPGDADMEMKAMPADSECDH